MPEAVAAKSKSAALIAEAVKAAKTAVAEADAKNKAAVRGTSFTASKVNPEKFIRNEIESRKEAIIAAIVAEALGE